MAVTEEFFGKTKDGIQITKYNLTNQKGMRAGVINYGAILVDLFVPDQKGTVEDVVLGYDTLEPYFVNGSCFGATIGPNANRIADASFTLNGKTYQLAINDGKNNLHSDDNLGYHKRVWDAAVGENEVTFSLKDADGSMGFPGNKTVSVTYCLTEENELKLHYHAESDQDTLLNLTNHTYFNLAGHGAGSIHNHKMQILADAYTPVLPGAIPTGELAPVVGTVFDFTQAKPIGQDIEADEEQLHLTLGYDHNFVIRGYDGSLQKAAVVTEPTSGRCMTVYTDLPGVQFYAGNCIKDTEGKEGKVYRVRDGFALETQFFPDTPHEPAFPSDVFGPGKAYDSTTIYQFS